MQKEQQKIFLVLETWERDGNHEGSPEVAAFSNIKAARKHLKELVKQDNQTGITESIDDPDEEWDIIDDDDHYYAFNESESNWVDFQVVELDVLDTDGDSASESAPEPQDDDAIPAEYLENRRYYGVIDEKLYSVLDKFGENERAALSFRFDRKCLFLASEHAERVVPLYEIYPKSVEGISFVIDAEPLMQRLGKLSGNEVIDIFPPDSQHDSAVFLSRTGDFRFVAMPKDKTASDVESQATTANIPLDADGFVTQEYCLAHVPAQIDIRGLEICITKRPYWYSDEGVFRVSATCSTTEYVVEWTSNGQRCDWKNPSMVRTLKAYLAARPDNESVTVSYTEFEAWAKQAASKAKTPVFHAALFCTIDDVAADVAATLPTPQKGYLTFSE